MSSSPSRLQRSKAPPPFQMNAAFNEQRNQVHQQKLRLSKSSISFGDQPTDWSTTLRPNLGSPGGGLTPVDFPVVNRSQAAAGISYNAQQGLYKNESSVCLGSDVMEYGRSNEMPNIQATHPDWQEWRGKKDVVFSGLIRKSSLKLGSDNWFYTKSTMQEMLEDSARHGFEMDTKALAAQKAKNALVQKRLRTSQIQLGSDPITDIYQRSNAMPWYSAEQVIDTRHKCRLDPALSKGLRKTNFVMGDDRLQVLKSAMSEQFPPLVNDTDFAAIKEKQKILTNQLRRTQFTIGDGTVNEYKRTSEMKDWSNPDTYTRPRTPVL